MSSFELFDHYFFAEVIFIIFMFINAIALINLLISMLGGTYNKYLMNGK